MSDSSTVTAAIIAALAADPELVVLMPGGIFRDVASPGTTQFVIVGVLTHHDEYEFLDEAYEEFVYVIKAVELASTSNGVEAAAERIRAVIEDVPLTIAGYAWMHAKRIEYVSFTEVNDLNETRWQHCGGQYELFVQPLTV